MKIFIICTVRKATEEYLKRLENYVGELNAKGHEVHFPPRDTNQDDEKTGGYRICRDNKNGIIWADEVHISYNEQSTGTHFDLGMAFALNKKIHVFDCPPIDESLPKSFPKMMRYWEGLCDVCNGGTKHVFEYINEFAGHIHVTCPKCGEKFNEINS